jgi:feruloyl esterase
LPAVDTTPKCDVVSALEAWVEQGDAPQSFIATRYVDDKPASGVQFERPVCVYPHVPTDDRHGERKVAASFRCAAPGTR